MGTIIFEIKRDEDCYFNIQRHPDGRKSSRINCTWSGLVDQFRNRLTTENHIKKEAIKWIEKNLNKEHDPQYSSKKDYEWLLEKLKNN